MTTTLDARAYRDDDGSWTVEIPTLTSLTPSGATIIATGSALSFRGVRKSAIDLASAWLDLEPADVDIALTVEPPSDVVSLLDQSRRAAAEAEAAIARADALRREAARALRAEGYPLEAAGSILGVTYQRVQQLAS